MVWLAIATTLRRPCAPPCGGEEHGAGFVLGLEAHQDDGRRLLEPGVGHDRTGHGDVRGEERGLFVGMGAGPEVDVIGLSTVRANLL